MKIDYDEFGNKIVTSEVGDGYIYRGSAVRVIEVDEDLMDVKVRYASNDKTEWIKDSQLDNCKVLPKR